MPTPPNHSPTPKRPSGGNQLPGGNQPPGSNQTPGRRRSPRRAAETSAPEALEQLSRTVLDLVIDHPFFGHLAGGMARVVAPDQPWPLVLQINSGRYTLSVSPRHFLALSQRRRRVAMEHELLHAVLGHPVLGAAHPEAGQLFGMACDVVVNQLLSAGPPLPDAFTLADLPAGQRTPDLTVEEYLTLLKRLYPPGTPVRFTAVSGHPWNGVSLSVAQLAQACFEPLLFETTMRMSSKMYGLLPAGLRSHLRMVIDRHQPALDWRRVLRSFSASSRRNRVRATLRRPSRRYHTYPGIRITRGQRLAVCVDTSGSVDNTTLAEFFAEIHHIWRAGAEVVVFEADAEVHRTWAYQGIPPVVATGRGGTAFEPALCAVGKAVPRFDACVYLTDGHGPRPATGPGVPLLWLITPDGNLGPHLAHGRSVRMRPPAPG